MPLESNAKPPSEIERAEHSVTKFLVDAYHNPLVDIGLGVAATLVASKALPLCERLFPRAEELLMDVEQAQGRASELRLTAAEAEKVGQNLSSRSLDELRPLAWQTRSPAVLDKLAEHSSPRILEHVASNPATAVQTFAKLLANKNIKANAEEAIAGHDNAPPVVLAKLAQLYPDAVAGNPNATAPTLDKLSELNLFNVDRAIAKHPNASSDTLERLAHSNDPITVNNVSRNSNTSAETLSHMRFDTMALQPEFLTPATLHKLIASNATPAATLKFIGDRPYAVKGMSQAEVQWAIANRH